MVKPSKWNVSHQLRYSLRDQTSNGKLLRSLAEIGVAKAAIEFHIVEMDGEARLMNQAFGHREREHDPVHQPVIREGRVVEHIRVKLTAEPDQVACPHHQECVGVDEN